MTAAIVNMWVVAGVDRNLSALWTLPKNFLEAEVIEGSVWRRAVMHRRRVEGRWV